MLFHIKTPTYKKEGCKAFNVKTLEEVKLNTDVVLMDLMLWKWTLL